MTVSIVFIVWSPYVATLNAVVSAVSYYSFREIQIASGEWINEFVRRPSRRKDRSFASPAEGLRKTLLRRSWSISSPSSSICDIRGKDEADEKVVIRKPPQKPPRRSLSTDDSFPPWDNRPPEKPPRRYSMSSFDGMSSYRRSAHVHSSPASRPKSPEKHDIRKFNSESVTKSADNHNILRGNGSTLSQEKFLTSPVINEIPKYYFFGNGHAVKPGDSQRASTLPRQPRRTERPFFRDLPEDRFHSMPRSEGRNRSPSGLRGRSEPAPIKEGSNRLGFIGYGPVTSTPVGRSVSSVSTAVRPSVSTAPIRSNSFSNPLRVTQDDIKLPVRRNFELLKNLGRANSSGEFWARTGRGTCAEVKDRDEGGKGSLPKMRKLPMRESSSPSNEQFSFEPVNSPRTFSSGSSGQPAFSANCLPPLDSLKGEKVFKSPKETHPPDPLTGSCTLMPTFHPVDSGLSGSSAGPSPDGSDEGGSSPQRQHTKRLLLPRSNTSVASGFPFTKSLSKKPSQTDVRRSKSFQSRSSRTSFEDELSLSPRKFAGGHVAKYVEELERGIQQTLCNMKLKRPSDSFREMPSKASPRTSRRLGREDTSSGFFSNLSTPVILGSSKIKPKGNDYKLAFISSDSAKESDFNSSIEYENSILCDTENSRKHSADVTSRRRKSSKSKRRHLVDIAVNTEGDYLSEDIAPLNYTTAHLSPNVKEREAKSVTKNSIANIKNKFISDMELEKNIMHIDNSNKFYHSMDIHSYNEKNSNYVETGKRYSHFQSVPPVNMLDPEDIQLMLQQTEVVQAEAQALQKALMGAFDSEGRPSPHWPVAKGTSEDSRKQKLLPSQSLNVHKTMLSETDSRNYEKDDYRLVRLSNSIGNCCPLDDVSYVSDDKFQSKYIGENDQKFGHRKEDKKIYENVDFFPVEKKVIKECKSVCIQTDFEPLLWEEEDSYETADYSDVSCDSVENNDTQHAPITLTSYLNKSPCSTNTTSTGLHQMMKGQSESISGNGQDSLLSTYLPNPPTISPNPQTPAVHLHLASDCDSSSVSLSSECGSVRGAFDVIRGHSAVVLKPKRIRKLSDNVTCGSEDKSDVKSDYKISSLVPSFESSSQFTARARAYDNGPSSLPPENIPGLTSGGRNEPLLLCDFGLPSHNRIAYKMSEVENKADAPIGGDVDASEEVISPFKLIEIPDTPALEDILTSSGTSECEDTDEEMHVSKSYNVSKLCGNESDEDMSTNSDKRSLDSLNSGSETDDEKQIAHQYDIAKTSDNKRMRESSQALPETESGFTENAADTLSVTAENVDSNHTAENNAKSVNTTADEEHFAGESNRKTKNVTETIKNLECRSVDVISSVCHSEHANKSTVSVANSNFMDSDTVHRERSVTNKFNNTDGSMYDVLNTASDVLQSKLLGPAEATDLPECDQAIGGSILQSQPSDVESSLIRNYEKEDDGNVSENEKDENELIESIVESKSETESTLGLDGGEMDERVESILTLDSVELEEMKEDLSAEEEATDEVNEKCSDIKNDSVADEKPDQYKLAEDMEEREADERGMREDKTEMIVYQAEENETEKSESEKTAAELNAAVTENDKLEDKEVQETERNDEKTIEIKSKEHDEVKETETVEKKEMSENEIEGKDLKDVDRNKIINKNETATDKELTENEAIEIAQSEDEDVEIKVDRAKGDEAVQENYVRVIDLKQSEESVGVSSSENEANKHKENEVKSARAPVVKENEATEETGITEKEAEYEAYSNEENDNIRFVDKNEKDTKEIMMLQDEADRPNKSDIDGYEKEYENSQHNRSENEEYYNEYSTSTCDNQDLKADNDTDIGNDREIIAASDKADTCSASELVNMNTEQKMRADQCVCDPSGEREGEVSDVDSIETPCNADINVKEIRSDDVMAHNGEANNSQENVNKDNLKRKSSNTERCNDLQNKNDCIKNKTDARVDSENISDFSAIAFDDQLESEGRHCEQNLESLSAKSLCEKKEQSQDIIPEIHKSKPCALQTVDNSRSGVECTTSEITGSVEVEQESDSCCAEAVTLENLSGAHEQTSVSSSVVEFVEVIGNKNISADNCEEKEISDDTISDVKNEIKDKESCYTSESGQSSGGESEGETKESNNVVKINVEKNDNDKAERSEVNDEGGMHTAVGSNASLVKNQDSSKVVPSNHRRFPDFSKSFAPAVPLRRAKRSSSSEGLSSSSDIERSDADASDSTDTVIDSNKLHSKVSHEIRNNRETDNASKDSDGCPSSADSVLQGVESESDGSESGGNLVTIVAVGEETVPRQSSQGKIYIRSDSTDSDVQIKPTCIVVTGSSGVESGDDVENENNCKDIKNNERSDVTILNVTSDHRKDHIMSVRVTSPESSRSSSPSRKSNVSELQSMILTHRERQQQFRRSPIEANESSGLTNYFTVTLGTDSPVTPRRTNKTPEVRRRKVPERGDQNDSSSSTPTMTVTPTLTPSPTHTPSPTVTPTPDHSEGDLLAYEEHHAGIMADPFAADHPFEKNEAFKGFYEDYDEQYDSYIDADAIPEEEDATFDSIEDTESLGESNLSETSSEEGYEKEEELRGYCKRGYDFTLHTIIEESCEESDYERRNQEGDSKRRDQSELEKYFYFGLGNGPAEAKKYANEESEYSDTFSETSSSAFSEGMESLDGACEKEIDPAELASSRLEKYFSGFLGFERQPSIRSVGEDSEIHTDESGSVGSDSEGSPSPEPPRKKLFRTRGVRSVSSSRPHGYSSDKGEGVFSDGSLHSGEGEEEKTLVSSEEEGSTESAETAFDKGDGQFDTIKRRKKKKLLSESDKKSDGEKADLKYIAADIRSDENITKMTTDIWQDRDSLFRKIVTDEPSSPKEKCDIMDGDLAGRKYQSRDSGFIGSSDDLLKDKPEDINIKEADSKDKQSSGSGSDEVEVNKVLENSEPKTNNTAIEINDNATADNDNNNNKSENDDRSSSNEGKVSRSSTGSSGDLPSYSQSPKGSQNLSRKDSFNNWSSDEETNIMMNKMRIFFKNLFSIAGKDLQKGQKIKSPQLVMFEAKLTNLMRSVPGINDEQVKEIVEYLSSEETWSDSYDSSDYTSSDLEGPYARLDQTDPDVKSELQEQISASCQQIIRKFDQTVEPSDTDSSHSLFGGRAGSESSDVSKDTAFVYQKLMSSISYMKTDSDRGSVGSGSRSTSPPLLMKVIHHIGDRIVALMHEVSAGSDIGDDADSFNGAVPFTSSPRQKLFLPKRYSSSDAILFDSSVDKSSLTSTSFESEDSPTDTEQSPDSDSGTPKLFRRQKLSIISEKSSAEDFPSLDSQRTVFLSNEYAQHYIKHESSRSQGYQGHSHYSSDTRNRWHSVSVDAEKFEGRDHIGLPKMLKSGRRIDTRKAKSHLSLEKIHHEDVKRTGERSESLGDLLDRVRSSSEYSSSYEQLDSDSTLRASDSLDRQTGSSSSNVRLNASSKGSLTTSSRGSLAASSRGSLNTSSRGSLQGSSGPDEEEDRKGKKLSFFRYARRSSVPDAAKDTPSPEVKSTTLPRSTPSQILTTGTLPRSQSSQGSSTHSSSGLLASHSATSPAERPSGFHSSGPRSARYHPPGYRPPPAGMPPKRTFSTPALQEDRFWHITDESGACLDDVMSASSSAVTSASSGVLSRVPPPPSRLNRVSSSSGSRAASPLRGSLGNTSAANSGNESVGGSLASFDNSPDEEEAKRRDSSSTDGTKSPLLALGPKSRSESLASVYSTGGEGRFGTVPIQGEILVSLQYNYKEGQLECQVVQCRDLAPVDTKRNRSDPYVKAYLLPDKSKSGKRKTKVKRHSLSPVFEEIFKFATTLGELESRTLWLSVWHSDMFGRNVFLGEVLIPLSDSIFEDSSTRWHTLLDKTETLEDLNYGAVLIVALRFASADVLATYSGSSRKHKKSRGALQVRVKEASGLLGPRMQTPPDPICKGVLMPERGKGSKQKTNAVRKTCNPRWNHTMTFDDVTLQDLTERSLELSIWDHDRFGSSEFMGGCRLNLGKGHHNNKIVEWLDASGLEQKLWEQMLERPNLWAESAILLRPNMDKPIYSSAFTD